MQVDVEEMRAGANRSYNAASFAMEGADQLGRATVGAGIFGGFAAAESFHGALSEAHSNHVQRLRSHENRLGVLGDKGHKAASVFVEMEERNAEALRSVL
ncbi:DUF2563 family protein [Mycolicibacterium sp. ELW1]|uniref:DUF2563 family protein n=1 Tax=Mycobacteriaceae TaxID=1762 RepID=UPI0011EDE87D|nr:DUF2563 family protein [Mycobacterium sp. ELW1]QEN12450.1 DUF2563 family protein [Mycobacterium sp. ELW1]